MQNLVFKILAVCLLALPFSLQAQLSGNQQVCIDASETYTSSLSGPITWTVSPTAPTLFPGVSSVYLTWNVLPGTYTITADNGTTTESLNVDVFATPTPLIQYAQNDCNSPVEPGGEGIPEGSLCDTFCVDELVTYTVTGVPGNSYLWAVVNGTIVGPNNGSSVQVIWDTYPGFGDHFCGMLTVTETNPAGCTGIDRAYGVAAYSSGTLSVTPGLTTLCLQQPATFNLTYTGGPFNTFTWDFGDGTVVVNGGATPEVHAYQTAGTYLVVVTAATECCSVSDTVQVVVESLPGPEITCITPVCAFTTGVEYCTDAVCGTYMWDVDGGVIVAGAGTSCITVDWGSGPVGEISLLTDMCSPALCTDTVFATVPIMPDGTFSLLGATVVCVGASGPYTAPYIPGASYTWTLIPPSGVPVVLPYHTPPYVQDVLFSVAGTYKIICYMEHDILDCTAADTLVIQTAPELSISGSTQVCDGTLAGFTSNLPADWTYDPPITSFGTSTLSASSIFPGPGVYTVTATAAGTCNGPQSLTVLVNPLPQSPVINGPVTVCPGGTYSYSVSGYLPSASYSWVYTGPGGPLYGNNNLFNLTLPVGFTSGNLQITVFENGCSVTASITLNAPSAPTPLITTLPVDVCPDQVQTYAATLSYPGLSDVTWSISPASAGTITPGVVPGTVDILWHGNSLNTLQNVTLTVTETACLGLSGTDDISLNIYPEPVVSAIGGAFCPGTSFTLTAGGASTYQWFDVTGTPVAPVVTAPGSYYVVGTDLNGCTSIAYTDVLEYPEPVASISTPDNVACNADGSAMTNTIQLVALDNSYNFLWSTGATGNPISVSSLGSYSVTVTDMNGCTQTDTYLVECTTPTPGCTGLPDCGCDLLPPTYTQGATLCNEFNFAANSTCMGGTFLWNFGDGNSGAGNSVNHIYTEAGYYHVTSSYADPTCCPPLPQEVVVAVPLAAHFTYELVCNTLTVVDNASFLPPYSITSWEWDWGDATPMGSGSNPGTHTYAAPGLYNVTLTVETASGCEASYSVNVVATGPAISATVSPTACNGPVDFTATVLGGSIIDWNWNFGDAYTSNLQHTEHIYDIPNTYSWYVEGTDAAGCVVSVSNTVTILAPPASFALSYSSPSCGPTLISIGGGASYSSYQWYNNGTAIPGATSATFLATASGSYTVEVEDNNGCIIESFAADILIYEQPVIVFTYAPILCSSDDIILQSNVLGPYSYVWKIDGIPYVGGSQLVLAGGTLSAGFHTVELTVTSTSGPIPPCTDYQTTTIFVEPSPTLFITSSDPGGICSGNPVTLTAVSPTAVQWDWSQGGTTDQITVSAAGNYNVVITDAVGCTASASANALIFPLPDLSMLPIGCDSSCITPNPEIIHGPPGMSAYAWYINNNLVSTLQDLELNTSNLPVFNNAYLIELVATSVNGCKDSASFEYTPLECDTDCFVMEDTIYCNPDGSYTIELTVTNLGPATSTYLWLHDVTVPFTLTPAFIVPLTLTTGATSAPILLNLSYPTGTVLPADICFLASLYNTDTCCHEPTPYCIALPDCDPCDDVSVSMSSDPATCCADITITNNWMDNYFTGIQIEPLSTGVSISSATVGAGWNAFGSASSMTFQPTSGEIAMGTYSNFIQLCLNVVTGAPAVQEVLVHWLITNPDGTQGIACTDTLLFTCPTPWINPCGEVEGIVTCLEDGTYEYIFTFTNNSFEPVTMLVFNNISPLLTFTPNPILLTTAVPSLGTLTDTIYFAAPGLVAGDLVCFDLTLANETGWCCHELDTVCIPIPPCTNCTCIGFESFVANVDVPGAFDYSILPSCGDLFTGIPAGTLITFTAGGYLCSGPAAECYSDLSYTLSGPISLDGSGLPVLNLAIPGLYTLTFSGSCGGVACDTCTITFEVVSCECGSWNNFNVSTPTKSWTNRPCGSSFNINTFDAVTVDGSFNCVGGCSAAYSWVLKKGALAVASGTGMPINFIPSTPGNYTLTILPNCGGTKCTSCVLRFKVKDAIIDARESSLEEDAVDLILLPNPASTSAQINVLHPGSGEGFVTIYNDLGQQMGTWMLSWGEGVGYKTIDIQHWPTGMYVVRWESADRVLTKQLMVIR